MKADIKRERGEVLIENWEILDGRDPYTAPEVTKLNIRGCVYGHPRHDDGTTVRTSRIVTVGKFREGDLVETRSGTLYRLGSMRPEYEMWWRGLN